MKALITGASSGLGADMARVLSGMGYDLILVARRKNKLEKLKRELKTDVQIFNLDISSTFNCMKLYDKVKKEEIDVLINNAGFGVYGEFFETSIDKELDMIDLNVKGLHTLTKLFLKDFKEKNKGYILNVASAAAFLPGPLMASYYASKAYVLRLTESIAEELRQTECDVYIGALCPGPVKTEFNKVAKVDFSVSSLECYEVASYAIKKMLERKMVIIPGWKIKIGTFFTRFTPRRVLSRISFQIQNGKSSS